MTLPTASDNEFPKVILEEVANDGSATVTPAADHRAVFLGEDGALHAKDSAGAVTTLGGDVSAHTADATDAHDASAISVLDTAANFTGTDVEAVLAELAAGGGGGSPWTLAVDEDGSDDTNWTVQDGTWASNGTEIVGDNDGDSTYRMLRYDTKIPFGLGVVVEFDLEFPTAGQGAGLDVIAGIQLASPGSTTDLGIGCDLYVNRDWLTVISDVTTIRRTFTPTINLDTTYTVRMAMNGPFYSVWLDGTLLGSGEAGTYINGRAGDYMVLYTFNALAHFSNIKVWHTTLPV